MADPQIGDYGVVDTPGFIGWAIRHVTRSPVSHAFVVVSATEMVEAMPGGARRALISSRPGAIFNTADPIWQQGVTAYGVSEQVLRQAVADAAMQETAGPGEDEGTGYGFADILAVGALQYGLRPKLIREVVARSDRLICSQLVDKSYLTARLTVQYLGEGESFSDALDAPPRRYPLHLFNDGRLPQDVTPGDLYKRIQRYAA